MLRHFRKPLSIQDRSTGEGGEVKIQILPSLTKIFLWENYLVISSNQHKKQTLGEPKMAA